MLENLKKKAMEHESYGDANCNWSSRYSHQILVQELEDLEIRGQAGTSHTTAFL